MTTYGFLVTAILLAQLACIAEMLIKRQTLQMPVFGGERSAVRKSDSGIGFYAMLLAWIALFAWIDVIVFRPSFLRFW